MFKFIKRPGLMLLCLLMALFITGCGADKNGGPGQSGSMETYTIADTTGDWGFPSPYGHYARGPGYLRMSFVFDTLIWKDAQGFVPALAEEWSYDEQNHAYTFDLRRDVTWHDGQPFTAGDVLFTFNYVQKHPYVWADTTNIAAVEDLGDYRIRVQLKEPFAPFLENVAGTLPMLPEHIWKDVDNPEQFRAAGALVGTGPFKLEDYDQEHGTYLYTANDNYYGGTPLVQKLRFTKVSKEMTQQVLQRGEANAADLIPEMVAPLEQAGFSVISGPSFSNVRLMINHQKEPFYAREFRQALAYAIDRAELVQVVARGHAVMASPGLVPQDSDWYHDAMEQYYDPGKAKALLEGLGYTLQDGLFQREGKPLSLELLVTQNQTRDGELIASQLAKIGIKVELKSLEMQTFDSRVENWQFDLAINSHGGLGGDPEMLNRMILGNGFNSARYTANQELNQVLSQQLGETNLEAREQLVYRAQELLAADVPTLSLYYPKSYFGHDGQINYYYTKGGISIGVPLPLNKMCFVVGAE